MRIFAVSTSSSHPAVAMVFPLWNQRDTRDAFETALTIPFHMIRRFLWLQQKVVVSVSKHAWDAVLDCLVPEKMNVDFTLSDGLCHAAVEESQTEFVPLHTRVSVAFKYTDEPSDVYMAPCDYQFFWYAAMSRWDKLADMTWELAISVPSDYGWNNVVIISWVFDYAVVYSGLQADGGAFQYPAEGVRQVLFDVFGNTSNRDVVRADVASGFFAWKRGSAAIVVYPPHLTDEHHVPEEKEKEKIREMIQRLVAFAHALGIQIGDNQILIV